MKLRSLRIYVAFQVLFLILAAMPAPAARRILQQSDEPKPISPAEAKRIIAGRAREVMLALKAGNIAKFATLVHPTKGVRFSPYASVLPDEDRLIKRNQLVQLWGSNKR